MNDDKRNGDSTLPIGLSGLFPTIPILCFISIICCSLLLPGFIKTRVFILIFYDCFILLGSVILMINMCIWRGNTREIIIYSDIVARLWHAYDMILYLSSFCFIKFVWNITRPEPCARIYDKRHQFNRIDAFICIALPILWSPFDILTGFGRYTTIEDIGPFVNMRQTLDGLVVGLLHEVPPTIASIIYGALILRNLWRYQHSRSQATPPGDDVRHQLYRSLSRFQLARYLGLSLSCMVWLIYGVIWQSFFWIRTISKNPNTISSLIHRINQLPLTRVQTRHTLSPVQVANLEGFLFVVSCSGIHLFIFFGLGREMITTYIGWVRELFDILGILFVYNWTKQHVQCMFWSIQRSRAVDPSNFTPFSSEEIAMEPHPSINPARIEGNQAPRKSTFLPFTGSPFLSFIKPGRIQAPRTLTSPPIIGTPFLSFAKPGRLRKPVETWQTAHKEPIPIHLMPLRDGDRSRRRDDQLP